MPTISLKPGVKIDKLKPQMALALPIISSIYAKYGYDTIVTSGNDGTHSNLSLHYEGLALDFRTRHVKTDDLGPIVAEIRQALDGEFDVVRETTHVHCEWDNR